MFRAIPFNFRTNANKGREMLENALETAADLSCNPVGRVSGALFPFRVDVVDTETAYEVFAELPGFKKDQLTVSYDDAKYLRIKAERSEPDYEVKFLCRERRTGSFERTFEIDGIDAEKVRVSLEDGVLHVVLPKLPEAINKKTFTID
ncbi:MAG: Hsp20 family protein [Selenomonadaceae bacterium]|nr:Hsp20 family protein [Selenomonadaceae bacterium]MDY3916282.1 Hsp20 family protein [Selenomonadaceae bacterium]